MISDFAQYPNQPGTSLNVDNINYATLRMQAALQRLQKGRPITCLSVNIIDDAGVNLTRHDLLGGSTGQAIEAIQPVLDNGHGLRIGGTIPSYSAVDIRNVVRCVAAVGSNGLGAEGVGAGSTSMDIVSPYRQTIPYTITNSSGCV